MPKQNARERRQAALQPLVPKAPSTSVEAGPNVDYTRTEVSDMFAKWDLVEDCLRGQDTIKKRGDKYLPRPNAADTSKTNLARYESYVARAVFYNVARKTMEGLVGQVFSRDPLTKIPEELKSMVDDVDGEAVSLDQQSRKGLMYTIGYGGFGLLTDYPVTGRAISKAEQKAGLIRPTIHLYHRRQIRNWRFRKVGAVMKLSLVVISEIGEVEDDGFEAIGVDQWRVLRLSDDNRYSITVYRKDEKTGAFAQYGETKWPLYGDGKAVDEIPFDFCGSMNNNASPDEPMLHDLCILNIAHYRNSADYEDSCYLVGQPTPVFAGLTQQWVSQVFKNQPIQLGSRAAVALPVGGTAAFLQAAPNSMPKEAMDQKEAQMAALGAKLIAPGAGKNTLGEAQIDDTTEASSLSTAAKNITLVYTKALGRAARFHNVTEMPEYSLNTDFPAARLTPNDRQQTVLDWQSGAITTSEMRAVMRKGGVATLDKEEYDKEIAENPPLVVKEMQNNANQGGADNAKKENKDAQNNGGNQSGN